MSILNIVAIVALSAINFILLCLVVAKDNIIGAMAAFSILVVLVSTIIFVNMLGIVEECKFKTRKEKIKWLIFGITAVFNGTILLMVLGKLASLTL